MDQNEGMVLWGCATPRTLRAHWALHELGLGYRCEPIQTRSGAAPDPRFAALNPRGKVPVLQDGGFTLTESAAIVTYLFAAYGAERGFPVPDTPRERARYDEWCFFLMTELDATSLYVLRRHAGLPHVYGEAPAAVEAAKAYFQRQVKKVADALADGRQWLMGDRFSAADILLGGCLRMAQPHGLALPDAVAAFWERAMARPTYASASQANQADHWTSEGGAE